ncbi:MAG: toprim domain-containing protein, partial [Dysgonamonadaceae bacterium]|nr:toprim domain-containing protein [Dysgonamonadaceae bacterium]
MLNKQNILDRTNRGFAVFRYYVPAEWRLGKKFLNPFYEDSKASCNIYYDRRSLSYKMKDFGNDTYSGDCFDIVGKIKRLDCNNPKDFIEILKTINRDLSLGIDENDDSFFVSVSVPETKKKKQPDNFPMPSPKREKPYSAISRHFSAKEKEFWAQYGITAEILKTYKIVSLKEFRSENNDGKPFTLYSTDNEPMFGYQGKRHIKIYRPKSEIRFLYGGLLPDNYCFGLEQLPAKGDTLFITGGEKDVLSLSAKGFHAICFNSETSNIPQSIIKKLSYRFKHLVLLYDTDKTGLEASARHAQQLADLGVKRLVLPLSGEKTEKDISDFFKLGKTKTDFLKLFIEFLDNLYSETMAILKPCEVDFGNPPIQSEMLISINGVPLGTQGNLLGITGGEGTGKSNYVGSLIAGTIREKENIDTLGTAIQQNCANKAVLLYDTEQS